MWTTVKEYVDIETGELINSSEITYHKRYRIIGKKERTELRNGYKNIKIITNECRKNSVKQRSLFEQ